MQHTKEAENEALASLLSPSSSTTFLPLSKKRSLPVRVAIALLPILAGAVLASIFWVIITPVLARDRYPESSQASTCDNAIDSATPRPEIHHAAPPTHVLECGNNSGQARAAHCEFQLWSYSWVPAPCFDPELTADFQEILRKENLSYYRPRPGTDRLDQVGIDVALAGTEEVLYSVWGLHYWHCAFFAQNFFRSRVALTNADLEVRHSAHCMEWFSQPRKYDWHAVNIRLPLAFHTCEVDSGRPLAILDWETIHET